MPEMPIDQDFGRFIEGITSTPDGGVVIDIDMEDSDVEEMEDGSAIVNLDSKTPRDDTDFYDNLSETMDVGELQDIALRYLELIDKDKEDRKERDKKYAEGLKRSGLGEDAPGGATFTGASKVAHPVLAEACVDFAARAIKEMFPPDGPTRTKILGDVTPEKTEKAERKRDYMNW